ncbi:MAG: TetR/AcrR family transcriptional regulator [Ilumatobacter sp.]|uniref:TetR/AcrR family transcriptional regulator n=1 Tax=Ilumatobacter sp. TaxID=1967498 RepID=UPI003C75B3DE
MTNVPTTLSTVVDPSRIDDDTDGRTLRRKRNRDAVIASLISLIEEGDLDPTVAKIADRAAVSHRSIFRYFDDLDDLARTAIETAVRDALPLAIIPGVGEGSLDHRIEGMVASRLRILRRTKQLIRVAHGKATALPEIDRSLSNVAEMTCDQFHRHFAVELSEMDPAEAEHLVAALGSQLGFEGYDFQSRMLSRTDEEIADSWRVLLRRVLR